MNLDFVTDFVWDDRTWTITHNTGLGYIGVDLADQNVIFCQGDDYTELFENQAHRDIAEFMAMLNDAGVLGDFDPS